MLLRKKRSYPEEPGLWMWGLHASAALSTLAFAPEWVLAPLSGAIPGGRVLALGVAMAALLLLLTGHLSLADLPTLDHAQDVPPARAAVRSHIGRWAAKGVYGAELAELALFIALLGSTVGAAASRAFGLAGGVPWLAMLLVLLIAALRLPGYRPPRGLVAFPAYLAIVIFVVVIATAVLNALEQRIVPIIPAPETARAAWNALPHTIPLESFAFGAALLVGITMSPRTEMNKGAAVLAAVHGFLFLAIAALLVAYGVVTAGEYPALFRAVPTVFGADTLASAAVHAALALLLATGMYATFLRLDRVTGTRSLNSLVGLTAVAIIATALLGTDVGTLAALWIMALLGRLLPVHVALLVRRVRDLARLREAVEGSGWRAFAHGLATTGVGLGLVGAILFLTGCARSVPDKRLDKIQLPEGFHIEVYVDSIDQARQMALGSNGTLYVGTKTLGKVYAVPNRNGDAHGDEVIVLASNLVNSNGVAFLDGDLYVAEESRVLRYPAVSGQLRDPPDPEVVTDEIPSRDYHEQVYMGVGPDRKLYVSIGAPCDVCLLEHPLFGTIARLEPTGRLHVVAEGVRNSMGFDWHPETGILYFTDNGRDWMGNKVPPDELNRVADGMNFGFPHCHGTVPDPEYGEGVDCSRFEAPILKLPAHVAALGMAFYHGEAFPPSYRNSIFIAEHGSYNRSERVGYRITMVTLGANRERLEYEVFAEGWLGEDGVVWGRPVDILVMPDGALLVSDDFGDAIYRITY